MKVLYLTYNGLTEPLGRRQVLPYVLGLAGRGLQLTVLSFEKRETADAEARRQVAGALSTAGVRWAALRYHRRPPVASTAYDVARGLAMARPLARETLLIHARSTVAALIAARLAAARGIPWIFDVRGLLAEEYGDAGHWRRGGLLFSLADRWERRLMRQAGGLVFLTESIREALEGEGRWKPGTPTAVIPCAADERTFRPSPEARARVRERLGLDEEPLLVYAGSVGSWYRLAEMMDFFVAARFALPGMKFLILTPQGEAAREQARRARLESEVIVRHVRPEEVPDHLAAADAGICFLTPCFSKTASSPTKYGEYLASGLPVVADPWTGDAGRLRNEPAFILVERFAPEEYAQAATTLADLLKTPEAARRRALSLAERAFSLRLALDRYEELYRKVARPCT